MAVDADGGQCQETAGGRQAKLLAVGENLDFAILPVADAFGADALAPVQVEVDNAAVGGGHRLQGDAAAGLDHPVGDPVGHFAQGVLPTAAVLFHIQGDADVGAAQLLAHDALDDELQGLEGVPPASDEQARVDAVDLNDGAAGEFVVLGAQSYGYIGADGVEDAGYGAEGHAGGGVILRDVVLRGTGIRGQDGAGSVVLGDSGRRRGFRFGFGRRFGFRRDGGQAGDADFGQFAADAQEPLAALI